MFRQSIFKLSDEKVLKKYCNKHSTTRDNDNVQSHEEKESKLNSTIITSNGAYSLIGDKIMRYPFNESNVANIKNK